MNIFTILKNFFFNNPSEYIEEIKLPSEKDLFLQIPTPKPYGNMWIRDEACVIGEDLPALVDFDFIEEINQRNDLAIIGLCNERITDLNAAKDFMERNLPSDFRPENLALHTIISENVKNNFGMMYLFDSDEYFYLKLGKNPELGKYWGHYLRAENYYAKAETPLFDKYSLQSWLSTTQPLRLEKTNLSLRWPKFVKTPNYINFKGDNKFFCIYTDGNYFLHLGADSKIFGRINNPEIIGSVPEKMCLPFSRTNDLIIFKKDAQDFLQKTLNCQISRQELQLCNFNGQYFWQYNDYFVQIGNDYHFGKVIGDISNEDEKIKRLSIKIYVNGCISYLDLVTYHDDIKALKSSKEYISGASAYVIDNTTITYATFSGISNEKIKEIILDPQTYENPEKVFNW